MVEDEDKSKQFDNLEDMLKASQVLPQFSKLHNNLKDSFTGLIEITKSFESRETEYKILIKTCLIDLFGLIEADIYFYNTIDSHPPQEFTPRFNEQMKLTFDQIAETFGKKQLVNEYFSKHVSLVKKLRKIRNRQVHPKEVNHLFNPTKQDLNDIIRCFERYDELINSIMSNFFSVPSYPSNSKSHLIVIKNIALITFIIRVIFILYKDATLKVFIVYDLFFKPLILDSGRGFCFLAGMVVHL